MSFLIVSPLMPARPLYLAVISPLVTLAFLCAWLQVQSQAQAQQQLSTPSEQVILEITGKISRTNTPRGAFFDRTMLIELGTATVRTSTPWTDGIQEFRGVLVRDVLDRIGAQGRTIRAVALNDYVIDIPVEDFIDYPVILALEMNGAELEVREKGPIWIIYPLDEFEALQDRITERRMVWQLRELQVQ